MKQKLITETFIKAADEIHNGKYFYDKTIYINKKCKVIIICKKHGEFEQTPFNHLNNKQGCNKCGGSYKLDNNVFIKRAKKIHKEKYTYNKVNYLNNKTKVIITCIEHGDFEQMPSKHLSSKQGCPKCAMHSISINKFIEMGNIVHNNIYNYDETIIINNNKKTNISCKIHGSFMQTPYKHLKGQGCPNCFLKKLSTGYSFIEKAEQKHSGLYNYQYVDYINSQTKIIIECKKHGCFMQLPNSHLRGQGCPVCKNSKGKIYIENLLKKKFINYKPQYSFEDLKFKEKLLFDFAILDKFNTLLCLIEYNGLQHYKFNKFMHRDMEGFELSKVRDQLKEEYCEKNNIKLYIIRYNEDIDKNFSSILEKTFL